MSDKKLEVLESRVLEAAKDCPTVKAALAKIFPETFKDDWEDVTDRGHAEWVWGRENPCYNIDGKCFLIVTSQDFEPTYRGYTYKIKDGRIWRRKV